MEQPLQIDIISLFPQMLEGFLRESMMKRAAEAGLVRFHAVNLRDFATDRHNTTDDRPFGGGPGMVLKPEPVFAAVESVRTPESHVVLMSPQGAPFRQADARRLATNHRHLVILCGHYEGFDERIRQALVDEEISIGDYVLTNGVLSAAVVVDAVVRLLPGALGGGASATDEESFTSGMLDYPQYTRPPEFRGMKVPEILLCGDHAKIDAWRREQARARTASRRPDLLSPPAEKNENNP